MIEAQVRAMPTGESGIIPDICFLKLTSDIEDIDSGTPRCLIPDAGKEDLWPGIFILGTLTGSIIFITRGSCPSAYISLKAKYNFT